MTIDDEFLEYNSIKVHVIDLPISVRGFVVLREDIYIVIINGRLSENEQRKALLHEVNHILSGQMDDETYYEYA